MFTERLQELITNALESDHFIEETVVFEHPADLSHGDYSTNIAFIIGKREHKSPLEVAKDIINHIKETKDVEKVEVAGSGFINFTLSRKFFVNSIENIIDCGEQWGRNNTLKDKKVMVEHTQPNPFKPFHIGHLMSNTIGESISRLYEFTGAEVRRANYQGDVGLHVAQALWGLRKNVGDPKSIDDLGKAYVTGATAYKEDKSVRDEIVEYNKMIYENAGEIKEDYEIGRRVSLDHFEELYALLGTKFDYYFFESEGVGPGRTLVKEGLSEGIFVESEGAIVFKGEEHGLHTRVFLNKEGLPTYEAKELGLAYNKREKWDFDLSVTTTAVEQEEYFKVVFKVLSFLMPEISGKLLHIPHGMMSISGEKMSSRKGNVITGESLLTDVIALATEIVEERDLSEEEKETISKDVGVAGIKYQILKRRAGKNIVFNPKEALSFDGNSGPYLQYAHTRGVSVLEKAKENGKHTSFSMVPENTTILEKLLYRFPEVVSRAQSDHEPHYVTTYLTELASAWNSWYAQTKILDGSPESGYRLAITKAFVHTMRNGLWLLGIKAPEKM